MWSKGKTLEDAVVIGEKEGGLYKLKGHLETTLFHETTSSSELWHSVAGNNGSHFKTIKMGAPLSFN